MTKFRMIPYDRVNDIWFMERRSWFIFWVLEGVGPKAKVQTLVDQLNKET